MKTTPAVLTPFIRSDAVGALLAEVLLWPERESSLADLSRRTGVSGSVVHKEVSRLVETGVFQERVQGRNRLVRAGTDHPLFSLMFDLVEQTYGPVPLLRQVFEGQSGIQLVFIYGSWAARRTGLPGPFPRDIDVLVVGTLSSRELMKLVGSVNDRLAVPVNCTRMLPADWSSTDPEVFVQTVKSRPYIDVMTGETVAR